MKNKTYLITGGTGFIGSALVRSLIKAGHRIRIIDNNSRGSIKRISDIISDVEFIQADIRDRKKVKQALRNIDCVIHLAAINGTQFFYTKPDEVLDVAVGGVMNVIHGSIAQNVPELFLASSSEVYYSPQIIPTDETAALVIPEVLNPRFSYSGGKIISELLTIHFGKKYFKRVVIFRPHNVYGPNMGYEHIIPQFILRMTEFKNRTNKSNKTTMSFPIQGTGKESRAYIYIDDAVRALLLLLQKGKHVNIYNIGTSEEFTSSEVAKKIAHGLGIKINIIPGKLLPGSVLRRCPDVTKISSLGFSKKISFDQGLPQVIQWYIQNEK